MSGREINECGSEAEILPLASSETSVDRALFAGVRRSSLKGSSESRRASTVTFSNEVNVSIHAISEEATTSPLIGKRLQGSDYRPIDKDGRKTVARIPTEAKLKTITHKVKRPAVDIEFYDLVYNAKTTAGTKTILKSISGSFESGKLSAIMGPSGAGKTSLMNILIGYVTNGVGGTILTNNNPRNMYLFNKLTTYIMQEDLLRPNLTVFESMMIAAHLKLGNELSDEDKVQAVEEVISSMGLEICRDVRTNSLSGGQRKRTSIALELVNNPPVLFLDEPTSGLDTVTTTQCLELLKDLAGQGRNVVCTLHQPSSSLFYMLDHVYFVANGYCVYQGSPQQLVSFLANAGLVCKSTYNPADYILEVLNNDTIVIMSKQIENGKIIEASDYSDNNNSPPTSKKLVKKHTLAALPSVFCTDENFNEKSIQFSTSFSTQFFILYKRKMIIQGRDTTSLWIQFGHHFLSALLLGAIFYGVGNDGSRPFDNFKFCISVLIFFMYTYTMAPVLLLPEEIKLLEREYFNRWYSLKSYYMVTLVSTIPPLLAFGTLFQVIVYLMTDQPMEWSRFIMFCVTGFLSASISEGFGILVGSLCSSATGSIVTPMLLVPLCVVAVYGMGFGQFVEPFMNFLMSLSFVRYLLVATCVSLYDARPDMFCPPPQIICLYKDPKLLLRDLGMLNTSHLQQFMVLANFYIFVRLLGYFALRYRLNKELSSKVMVILKKILKRK